MRIFKISAVLLLVAGALTGCGSSPIQSAREPFNGECGYVTDTVVYLTTQLNVLPLPGVDEFISEEDISQRIVDGGWDNTLQYMIDLNHSYSDLTLENYTSDEEAIVAELKSVIGENSRLVAYQGQAKKAYLTNLEDWLSRFRSTIDKLNAMCNT